MAEYYYESMNDADVDTDSESKTPSKTPNVIGKFSTTNIRKTINFNFMTLIVAFCRMLEPREPRVLKSQFKTKWLHASLTVKYTFLFKT